MLKRVSSREHGNKSIAGTIASCYHELGETGGSDTSPSVEVAPVRGKRFELFGVLSSPLVHAHEMFRP